MNRPRRHNRHLPARLYFRHGAYYLVRKDGRWEHYGRDYAAALRRYAGQVDRAACAASIELLIARYEAEVLPANAAKTQHGRRAQFKRLRQVFGHMRPEDLRAADAWEYFETRGRLVQARKEISALSAVISMGVKWGALERNPLLGMRFPQAPKRDRYVTDQEFVRVYRLAPPMIQCAMVIALATGMRLTDLLKLERRDMTDAGLYVRQSKTGKELAFDGPELRTAWARALSLPPHVRRHVIATREGKPYTADGFASIWQRLMLRATATGMDRWTFRDLRAKNISDEPSVETASRRAGHATTGITKRVYRRLPEQVGSLSIGHLREVLDSAG